MTGKRQAGFNLIENLVTLFILSVGLLGIAAMQASALRGNQTSSHYSSALILAQDIADRMRANREGTMNGYYKLAGMLSGQTLSKQATCDTTGCSAEKMAKHDLWQIQQQLAHVLPSADVYICLDATPDIDFDNFDGAASTVVPAQCSNTGNNYAIHVVWDMTPQRAGAVTLDDSPSESDGHLVLSFEP